MRLGREVAVKVLPAEVAADAERVRRFELEARAVATLNHPNILALYDVGSHDGAPFLVTELLEGETLRSRLRRGRLTAAEVSKLGGQVATGLGAAHDKGIVHRDLKPENLFVTADGTVKILDFGLARQAPGPAHEESADTPTVSVCTAAGAVLGTVGYMSPEQARGRPAGPRSDVFAFGCVLYEMLAGERAFRGDTAADTLAAVLTREPPELERRVEEVPPSLAEVVRRCLRKDPGER
ncbi:MAG: serine/threonine protein kinase, partial [Acidimicrobiales bacterium]|nr:serine/threonine protein kinase [Acidimicrobiales bacterium]